MIPWFLTAEDAKMALSLGERTYCVKQPPDFQRHSESARFGPLGSASAAESSNAASKSSPKSSPISCPIRFIIRAMLFGSFSSRSLNLLGSASDSRRASSDLGAEKRDIILSRCTPEQCAQAAEVEAS